MKLALFTLLLSTPAFAFLPEAPGDSKLTRIENAKYLCYHDLAKGGVAFAVNGSKARIWMVEGAIQQGSEGLELSQVTMKKYRQPNRIDFTGLVQLFGESQVLLYVLKPDVANGFKPYLTIKADNTTAIQDMPCDVLR